VRIKYLLREIDRRTETGEEPLLSMRRDHGLVPLSQFSNKVAEPKALLAYKLVRPGELVVNRMQAGNGLVFVARIPGLISPDYAIFRPVRDVNLDYLELLFRSYPMRAKFRSESTGLGTGTAGFLRLYGDALGAIEIGLPPADEQAQIVRFLGYADRQVRRYIHAKKKLITLVNEQKQALIHHAVTRGVDPSVRLKGAGVAWIGNVPEHWEVVRNKTVCQLGTGHTPSRRIPEYWEDCLIPWVTLGDVHQLRDSRTTCIEETRECISELGLANSAAVKLPAGTVILSRTASVGFSAILAKEMATSQDFMAWIPGERVVNTFLLYVLRSMKSEFKRLMYGSTHNTIYMPSLHAFSMPLPPKEEQSEIVAYIETALPLIDSAAERTHREVLLLSEYRTRLIADVVTGTVDVRAAVARLPDQRAADGREESFDNDVDASDSADADEAESETVA
jgi:type I restriction enzyme S subunit